MAGIGSTRAEFTLVRRVVTRSAGQGGEDYEAVSNEEFRRRREAGAFCIHWEAHGLSYGIPDEVRIRVGEGEQMLVNLSRNVLGAVAEVFPHFEVLSVTASPETLSKRLAGRAREPQGEIARRLNRTVQPFSDTLTVHSIRNEGHLEDAVTAALTALQPVRV